ncbi:MAG: hypothetical protein OEM40_07315 [Acidimicrobiia bacterium]|nr:hypothetical protein [Acidimicrobiia bacterium]
MRGFLDRPRWQENDSGPDRRRWLGFLGFLGLLGFQNPFYFLFSGFFLFFFTRRRAHE